MADEGPTHRVKKTGALVFPEGHRATSIEKLSAAELADHRYEQAMAELRATRNQRLQASGEFMWPDRPMPEAERQKWIEYRQQLRDLPSTADPLKVKWPKAPNEGQSNG